MNRTITSAAIGAGVLGGALVGAGFVGTAGAYGDAENPTPDDSGPQSLLGKILLAVASPLVFLALAEGAIALSGIDTDLARNENAQIVRSVSQLALPESTRASWILPISRRMRRGPSSMPRRKLSGL